MNLKVPTHRVNKALQAISEMNRFCELTVKSVTCDSSIDKVRFSEALKIRQKFEEIGKKKGIKSAGALNSTAKYTSKIIKGWEKYGSSAVLKNIDDGVVAKVTRTEDGKWNGEVSVGGKELVHTSTNSEDLMRSLKSALLLLEGFKEISELDH